MNQVHKETLSHVENAIPGRSGLDIEIFGMEGVPQEVVEQHNQQVTHKHFEEEQERARVTGNPVRGLYSNGTAPPNKRTKVKEGVDEIVARAAKFRQDRANGVLPVAAPVEVKPQPVSNLMKTPQYMFVWLTKIPTVSTRGPIFWSTAFPDTSLCAWRSTVRSPPGCATVPGSAISARRSRLCTTIWSSAAICAGC